MTYSLIGLVEVVANSMERTENISEIVSSPQEETGLQGRSELCVGAKQSTTLPNNIVTGVTLQLQPQSSPRQRDQKVSSYNTMGYTVWHENFTWN